MTYRGKVYKGVIELEHGVDLPEGAEVRVEVLMPNDRGGEPVGNGLFDVDRFAVTTGVPDLSVNIDHYLYGPPKVVDGQ